MYKTRYDWVRNDINRQLRSRLKFDYSTKLYNDKLQSIPKNETGIMRNKRITLIPARRPDLVLTRRKNLSSNGLHLMKEIGKIDKYSDLARQLKKLWSMEVTVILILIGTLGAAPDSFEEKLPGLEIKELKTTRPQHC